MENNSLIGKEPPSGELDFPAQFAYFPDGSYSRIGKAGRTSRGGFAVQCHTALVNIVLVHRQSSLEDFWMAPEHFGYLARMDKWP